MSERFGLDLRFRRQGRDLVRGPAEPPALSLIRVTYSVPEAYLNPGMLPLPRQCSWLIP